MRLEFLTKLLTQASSALLVAASLSLPASAQTSGPIDPQLAHAVADFSADACYGIASGATILPTDQTPATLKQTMAIVEKMGLEFGVDDKMLKDLGDLGQTLVSRSTMGSKALGHGNVVVTFGGPQPGCRVILLADNPVNLTDAIGIDLAKAGWKAVPSMTTQRSGMERHAFVKRDAQGNPYLMNLISVGDAISKIRLFTTTIRIPAGVVLPPDA